MTKRNKSKKVQQKQKKATPFADAGAITGQALGQMFRMPYLKGVGKWLGSGIGQIFGSGDYQMVGATPGYNVLTNDRQIPKFSSSDRTNIVCHREYIGDILGQPGFNNRPFPLNPGMSETFPWLSQVAKNYQQYRFHGLIFEFRPLITDFVTGGAPGVVVLATNYNADRPPFTSRVEMENSEYAVSVKPTNALMHGVECNSTETPVKQLYIRSGAVPAGQDLRLYDLGLTQFASQANPNQTLGELWVSYCVEFFKPALADDSGIDAYSANISRASGSNTFPLGTVGVSVVGDLSGYVSVSPDRIIFNGSTPAGTYLVNVMWTGDTTVSVVLPTVNFISCTPASQFFSQTVSTYGTENTSVVRRVFLNITVTIPVLDSNIFHILELAGATLPTGNLNVNIYVAKVDTF